MQTALLLLDGDAGADPIAVRSLSASGFAAVVTHSTAEAIEKLGAPTSVDVLVVAGARLESLVAAAVAARRELPPLVGVDVIAGRPAVERLLGLTRTDELPSLGRIAARAVAMARSIAMVRDQMIGSLPARMQEIELALSDELTTESASGPARLLHRLRGSAGSVGLAEVAEVAGRFESMLTKRPLPADDVVATMLDELRDEVGRLLGA